MRAVKLAPSLWALRPKKKAWDFSRQIGFLGARYDRELGDWYVRDQPTKRKVLSFVKKYESFVIEGPTKPSIEGII